MRIGYGCLQEFSVSYYVHANGASACVGAHVAEHLKPCRKAPFHSEPCFPPLAFFNCHEGREHGSGGGASLANASEAELAAVLYGGGTTV